MGLPAVRQRLPDNLTGAAAPDNLADDFNGDNVPDYYPSLYSGRSTAYDSVHQPSRSSSSRSPPRLGAGFRSLMAFPYVFPGAYSCPQVLSTTVPRLTAGSTRRTRRSTSPRRTPASRSTQIRSLYLQNINHNPIDLGDNLPLPGSAGNSTTADLVGLSDLARDALARLDRPHRAGQPRPGPAHRPDPAVSRRTLPVANDAEPAAADATCPTPTRPISRSSAASPTSTPMAGCYQQLLGGHRGRHRPALVPELGRRPDHDRRAELRIRPTTTASADYADLGWGDDPRLTGSHAELAPDHATSCNCGTPTRDGYVALALESTATVRPAQPDLRPRGADAAAGRGQPVRRPVRCRVVLPSTSPYRRQHAYTGNIGDDQAGIVRLRRVWDSWSTDYSHAPGTGVYLNKANATDPLNGFPWGPPYTPPIYPSYPPPYPAPLRGIQIQIRVTDPTNQRIKTLTIRQDFTDKL